MADAGEPERTLAMTLGVERLGLQTLKARWAAGLAVIVLSALAVVGLTRLGVDDSLSELFRTNTKEFRTYEQIDKLFPSSEYDVLVVVESKDLLKRDKLKVLSDTMVDLQLADGINGLVSMFSARGKPDSAGYAAPVVPDQIPEGAAYDAMIQRLRTNEIVSGKFLSNDGTLALAVVSLNREVVKRQGAAAIIGGIQDIVDKDLAGSGLHARLTGAPVMQLEIRNAVERDQMVYNGLGLLFGAGIALIFFRRISLMLLAAVPPVVAVVWALGTLGWLGFKMNLFLNVMTPLVMVMGFSDSMQMVSAVRDRLRHGDSRLEALKFAVRVVGPACVLAHATAMISFIALMTSESGLIRTFGIAGAIATLISYAAVLGVLPLAGLLIIRDDGSLSHERLPSDRAMDWLGEVVGAIVDRVVNRPFLVTILGLLLFAVLGSAYTQLQPRYRLADQVPDREQALKASGQLDQKLTGANPVHVMITWKGDHKLFDKQVMDVISQVHSIVATQAGLGNVWSLDSLRRWLAENGDNRIETVQRYVRVLPEHLVRRFITKDQKAVLVTGRLPDVDASEILPVVERLDHALDKVRAANPDFTISVTGLPAIAARSSSGMIKQLLESVPIALLAVAVLIGLAFRSVASGVISLLPGIFPIVATGAGLWLLGLGIEFASVVALIIIFGLGVDALIHFLNRLDREERSGVETVTAIRRARVLVGPAIILTTVVLAFGLGVTVFSDLPSLRLFGGVCAVALLASLIGDLVFLPALVAVVRKIWPVRSR
ncbi:MAG: efflux RND transporter permease subunit [Hyphomicrobiaceae bacterium]